MHSIRGVISASDYTSRYWFRSGQSWSRCTRSKEVANAFARNSESIQSRSRLLSTKWMRERVNALAACLSRTSAWANAAVMECISEGSGGGDDRRSRQSSRLKKDVFAHALCNTHCNTHTHTLESIRERRVCSCTLLRGVVTALD